MGEGKVELKTKADSLSYAIGVNMAESLKKGEIQPNTELLFAATRETLAGKTPLMNEQQCMTAIHNFMREQQQAKQAEDMKLGAENLAKGKEFLAKVKEEEGVIAHESGVLYKIMKEGEGEAINETDKIKVHYHGTLIDGTVFDSSVEKNTPYPTSLNAVIPGWKVMDGMKVGTKCKLYIPSDLAYGPQGRPGGKIGSNSVLIFEVEILEKTTEATGQPVQ